MHMKMAASCPDQTSVITDSILQNDVVVERPKQGMVSRSRLLVIILLLSVLVRIATALYMGNKIDYLPAVADQISYHTLATRVFDGHGFSFAVDWWPATRAGEPTAHWSYLYTLYLTLVYAISGENILAARLIQAVFGGLLMPWFIFRLAQRVFHDSLVGVMDNFSLRFKHPQFIFAPLGQFWRSGQDAIPLIAAAWVAVYGYFIYFAPALMTETFYIIGILWTLDCALRIRESWAVPQKQPRLSSTNLILPWLELGAAIGVTALLRQVFLLFIPFLFIWLWWAISSGEKKSITMLILGTATAGLMIALLISPATIYNYQRFGRFVLLNTNAGYAFYWSNHPIYGSKYISILPEDMPTYRELLPQDALWMNEAALDQELLRRGIGFVIADPLRYIKLSLGRIPAYFIFWPSSISSQSSNISRVISFGVALPFILAGYILWSITVFVKRKTADCQIVTEPGTLLLFFTLVYSSIHLLSWAAVRYRLPVDAVGLVFAARGLHALGSAILFHKPEPTKP